MQTYLAAGVAAQRLVDVAGLEGGGHLFLLEEPAESAQTIDSFLRSAP